MNYKTLNECYARPSQAKQTIYRICTYKAQSENATEYGILSYNGYVFTFGYTRPDSTVVVIRPSNYYRLCRDFI